LKFLEEVVGGIFLKIVGIYFGLTSGTSNLHMLLDHETLCALGLHSLCSQLADILIISLHELNSNFISLSPTFIFIQHSQYFSFLSHGILSKTWTAIAPPSEPCAILKNKYDTLVHTMKREFIIILFRLYTAESFTSKKFKMSKKSWIEGLTGSSLQ